VVDSVSFRGERSKLMPEEAKAGQDPDETEVIDGTEVYLRRETRNVFAFNAVKITLLTKQGKPIPSGVRRVLAGHFEVEAPDVNKLFVKSVRIEAAGVEFDYMSIGEFDLPAALEVGTNGILQKTVPDHFPVGVTSREVVQPSCSHRGGMP
jgi:hypothetical protein